MTPILFVVLTIFLLLLVSGGYVFCIACVRRKELAWLFEEEIKKTTYGQYYEYMMAADQWLQAHTPQDIYITSHDGLKLHGLWIPAKNPTGTMLLVHGYRSTILADFGAAYDFYHNLGFNILVPQQRSHGASKGKYITFGVKESKDIADWIQYHNTHFGMQPLVLSGISMGASTVLFLADKQLPSNVKGIIADCAFTSPKDIISSVYRNVIHLPAAPTIWVADKFARVFAHFSLSEQDTRRSLAHSKLPVLMIHGSDDDFVPCDMTRQGYAACSAEKSLLIVEGADHGVSFLVDPEGYKKAVIAFLKKTVNDHI